MRGNALGETGLNLLIAEIRLSIVEKLAKILLPEPLIGLVTALELKELLADTGTFGRGRKDLGPSAIGAGPDVMKEAAAAVGRAEEDDRAVAGGADRPQALIFAVGNTRSFLDDEHSEGAEASRCVFRCREGDEAGGVGGLEGVGVVAVAAGPDVELAEEGFHLVEELVGLSGGGSDDDDGGVGMGVGVIDGFEGDYGGLAVLAAHANDCGRGGGAENLGLL